MRRPFPNLYPNCRWRDVVRPSIAGRIILYTVAGWLAEYDRRKS